MQKKQILVIDDDTDLSYIISDMLEDYGYSVTCAEDSDTAFSLLTDHTYYILQFALRFLLVSALGSAAGVLLCILLNNRMLSLLLRTVGITNFITEYSAFTLLVPIVLICSCFFLFSYFTSEKVKSVEIKELITE